MFGLENTSHVSLPPVNAALFKKYDGMTSIIWK